MLINYYLQAQNMDVEEYPIPEVGDNFRICEFKYCPLKKKKIFKIPEKSFLRHLNNYEECKNHFGLERYEELKKERRLNTKQKYNEKNRDEINRKQQKYNEENREEINEKQQKYNIENREEINEKQKLRDRARAENETEEEKEARSDKYHFGGGALRKWYVVFSSFFLDVSQI